MNEFFKKPIVKILMLKGEKGEKGETGTGTPTGGKPGQYLQKKSDADYDYVWSPITTVSWDNVSGKPDAYPTTWDNVSGKTNATESAAGLMSAEDKSKLDNLQVGGRNLLTNSKGEFSGKYPSSGVIDIVSEGDVPLPTGVTHFVLSFDAKSTVDGDVIRSYFFSPSNVTKTENSAGQVRTSSDGECFTTLTTDWKRYWVKWTAPIADTRSVLPFRLSAGDGTGTVSMRNVKFETGTVPTDWTPAPEDVDSKIDALNSVTKKFTLTANNWVHDSGLNMTFQNINDPLITETSNQEVIPDMNITPDQMKAFQKANIIGYNQSAGVASLRLMGTQPTIDIPITVIFRGTI